MLQFFVRRTIATICGCLLVQPGSLLPLRAQQTLSPAPALPAICPNQLPKAIEAIVDRPELRRYRWGIVVRAVNSNNPLYNRDGDRLFIPASNVKLIATAVALRQLGATMRLRTSVYRLPGAGNLPNLLVVGRGDPSLTVSGLQSIGQQLRQQGIDRVGDISFDDGYFRGEAIHPDWEWGDLAIDYAAAINGLMINQNSNPLMLSPQRVGLPLRFSWKDPSINNWSIEDRTTTLASGKQSNVNAIAIFGKPTMRLSGKMSLDAPPLQIDLPLLNPAESFITAFRQSLNRSGITVGSTRLVYDRNPINLPELAAINSPPVAELIAETNQRSNNIYAEVLLKSIGRTHPEHYLGGEDTNTLGLALVKRELTAMGVDPQAYKLSDGSGLSRHNLVAPMAFVQVLSAMATTPTAQVFRDSLPLSGVSGSLKNRLKGSIAQGIVRAKTGSLSGIASLSGYINPPQYSPLVFSIIVNQHERPTSQMVKVIDEIVVELARLKQC